MNELIIFTKRHARISLCLFVLATVACFFAFSLQPNYFRLTGRVRLPRLKIQGTYRALFSNQRITQWVADDLPRLPQANQFSPIFPTITTTFADNSLVISFVLTQNALAKAQPFLQFVASNLTQFANSRIHTITAGLHQQKRDLVEQKRLIKNYYLTPITQALNQYYALALNPKPIPPVHLIATNYFGPLLPQRTIFSHATVSGISRVLRSQYPGLQHSQALSNIAFYLDRELWNINQKAASVDQQIRSIKTLSYVEPPIQKEVAKPSPLLSRLLFALLLGLAVTFLLLCCWYYGTKLLLLSKSSP